MDKVDEMPAGRPLDARVAEKVMGFQRDTDGQYRHPNTPFAAYPFVPKHRIEDLPRYSSDIGAAWEVFHKLVAMGFLPSLSYNGNQHAAAWDFRMVHKTDTRKRFISISETPELAICRAALKTLEDE